VNTVPYAIYCMGGNFGMIID